MEIEKATPNTEKTISKAASPSSAMSARSKSTHNSVHDNQPNSNYHSRQHTVISYVSKQDSQSGHKESENQS